VKVVPLPVDFPALEPGLAGGVADMTTRHPRSRRRWRDR
jgi:hypothetical protein